MAESGPPPVVPRRSPLRCVACFFRRWILLLIMLLLALIAYGQYVGLPPALTRALIEHWLPDPWQADVQRVRLDGFNRLRVDELRLYRDRKARYPLSSISRMQLSLDPREWLHGRPGLRDIECQDGEVILHPQGKYAQLRDPEALRIGLHRVRLVVAPGTLTAEPVELDVQGIPVTGRVVLHPGRSLPDLVAEWSASGSPDTSPEPEDPATGAPGPLNRMIRQWNQAEWLDPAEVSFAVELDLADASANRGQLQARGGRTRIRGVLFDGWSVAMNLDGHALDLSRIEVSHGVQTARFSGKADLASMQAEGHLFSNLPPVTWMGLLPSDWRQRAEQAGTVLGQAMTLQAWVGPAPIRDLGKQFTGWVDFEQTSLRGVWFEKGYVSFAWKHPELVLDRIEGTLGKGRRQGPAEASFRMNLDTGAYRGAADGRFVPTAALSVLGDGLSGFLRRFAFDEVPPHAAFEFGSVYKQPGRFWLDGRVDAETFIYNGAYAESVTCGMHYTNSTLRLDAFHLTRREGALDGWIELDFENGVVTFDAESTLDLQPLSQIVTAPVLEQLAGYFRSEGPLSMRGKGVYGFHPGGSWNGRFEAEAEQFGYSWLMGDRCRAELVFEDRRLTVTNVEATVYGGTLVGNGEVDIPFEEVPSYRFNASWKQVDLAELVRQFKQVEHDPYKGAFTGTLSLAGRFGETPTEYPLEGSARVHLREGYLFKVPLFGGLSRYIAWIYPDLGFSSQSDFDASFVIADNRVTSEDIEFEGNLLSMNARGSYGFDHQLQFDVEVKPLGENVLAEALRVLTMPVSTLLKFKLSGTLTEPVWKPDNWPGSVLDSFRSSDSAP